ncbi:ABC-2 transporter permease [Bacillus sp. 1P06AnD]|uniref:ABC-2 transporter permease n=1 Tax=Bacillus sp. 1P06AnD TaxID=3132208 RepID=UPI0039A251B3
MKMLFLMDFYLYRKTILIISVIDIVWALGAMLFSAAPVAIYIVSQLVLFFMFIFGELLGSQEERSVPFVLSLPVTKQQYLLSRYIEVIAITVANWAMISISIWFFDKIGIHLTGLTGGSFLFGLGITGSMTLIILAAAFPLFFVFGRRGIQYLTMIAIIISTLAPAFIKKDKLAIMAEFFDRIGMAMSTILIVTVCLLLYIGSFFLSLSIFSSRIKRGV